MQKFIKERSEIIEKFNGKMVFCSNGYMKARKYKKPLERLKDGFEPVSDSEKISAGRVSHLSKKYDSEIRRDSLTRTRDTIILLASENEEIFKSFLTLTFSENIIDIDEANKFFALWVRSIKRIKPDFAYLCVPEFQKRGAVHYHLITNLVCGEDIPKRPPKKTFNTEKKRAYILEYYDIPYWNKGYSTAEDLTKFDSNFNKALYMVKYLFKDIDNRLWGRNKIMRSNNLKMPEYNYVNNETFDNAIEYINKKGYPITEYDFQPVSAYQIPFMQYTLQDNCRLLQEDINTVTGIVQK